MAWENPVTTWGQAGQTVPRAGDFNRIEGNTQYLKDEVDSHKADYTLQVPFGGTTTNSGNNYSIASPAISALTAGVAIAVKINTDSTGATTLNWNSKGAKPIKKANGTDVTNLKAGGIYTLRYDGTNFILQGSDSAGDAAPGDVLTGKTFSNDEDIEITGTMPNRGAVNQTLAINGTYTIPAGYHNGAGKVTQSIIKSIQKGLIAISTGTTATATIANINPNNALLFYVGATEGWATTTMMPYLELVNSTTVRATRYENLAELTTVSFLVVEFQSALKSVQRGVIQIPPSVKTSTATIASVDVNKALLFFLGYAESFGRTSYAPYLELVNSTTVRATRHGFSSESYALSKVSYQIVEF